MPRSCGALSMAVARRWAPARAPTSHVELTHHVLNAVLQRKSMLGAAPSLSHPTVVAMSTQDLQWLLVRKSNSFLVKQKGLGRVFSREPGNLASLHSYKVRSATLTAALGHCQRQGYRHHARGGPRRRRDDPQAEGVAAHCQGRAHADHDVRWADRD